MFAGGALVHFEARVIDDQEAAGAEEDVADVVGSAHRHTAFGRRRQVAHVERHLSIAEVERRLLRVRRLLIVVPAELPPVT